LQYNLRMPDTAKDSRRRDPVSDVERACIEKGMKMTEQRRVIARVLSNSVDHPDVETVYQRASEIDSGISIATVYRTLRMFDVANIIDRHDFGDGRSRYEPTEPGEHHHHHLIDMRTGVVHEFDDDELERIKQRIAAELGYEIVGERLELYGVPLRGGAKKS
jgi:Fur family ferric uptake transcriptional regulator